MSFRRPRSFALALTLVMLAMLAGFAARSSAATGAKTSARGFVASASSAIGPSRPWVMGYYPEYQASMLPVSQVDWSGLTHLAVGPLVPNNDGTLDQTFDIDATHGPALAKQLTAAAKAHHVVPILMVGGAGAQQQYESAAGGHLPAFVSNLLTTMRTDGFVGLDLDWEPVSTSDEPVFMKLVDSLKAADPSIVLTVPVGWNNYQAPEDAWYGQLAEKVDRVDIMAYGMAGAYPGWKTWYSSPLHGAKASTPVDIASQVKAYEAAGVPAGKIGLGIGFYGTCWAGGVNGPNQTIGSSSIKADDNVMTYTAIMKSYYNASAYHYDAKADAPYLGFSKPTGPQGCTFISYENATSIAAKGAYATQQHLGGAIIWTIPQGHVLGTHRDPLLDATRKAFHA